MSNQQSLVRISFVVQKERMNILGNKGILAGDLFDLKSVTDPQLSPDGSMVAYIETSVDKEDERYISNIFIYNFIMKQTIQWTYGLHRQFSPRWSPDGLHLAFLSNRSGKNQIYIMNTTGGEANQLTDFAQGATTPIWAPDSRKILTSTRIKAGYTIDEKENELVKKRGEAIEYDRIKYKSDGSGYLDQSFSQLILLDLPSGRAEQLTSGEQSYIPSSWAPNSKEFAYVSNNIEAADYNLASDVFIFQLEARSSRKITATNGLFYLPKWSPDGNYLTLIGHEREYEGATISKIWLYTLATNSLTCLTADWDVEVSDVVASDFHIEAVNPGILWTNDSQGFYFLISDHGNTGVYYGTIEGAMYPSLLEKQHVYGLTIDPQTHMAIVAISTPTHPGDLYSFNLTNGEIEQITFVNDEFLNEKTLSKAESITFSSKDDLEIHGWIMKPINLELGKKYPLVLEIHGGPHAMYANTYVHEFQTLVAQGYSILFTNPRGSAGYGQEFANSVRGDYGGMDYEDLMAAVDYVLLEFDFVDKQRLGVTGGSYGGFMTNWIIGHTDRFKAAVTQRCISNWLSFYGVSDIGYSFTEWELGGNIIESPEKLWEHSPLKYVKNITTPLLLLHGDKDYRCPIEQAEQLFVALKRQKKEAVLVVFPNQTHEVSRSGAPRLRMQHTEQICNWFAKHIN